MEMPNVDNVIVDRSQNIHINVKAYRKLTRYELLGAIRVLLSQKKRKLKRNSRIVLISTIGHDD